MPPPRRLRTDADDDAGFLRRLMADRALLARFQRDPEGTARAYGLPGLADELAEGGGGIEELEQRQSRSSLAGVFTSFAIEGADLFGMLEHHLGPDVASAAVPTHHGDHVASASSSAADAAGDDSGDDDEDGEDHDPGEDVDDDGEDSPDDDDGEDDDDSDEDEDDEDEDEDDEDEDEDDEDEDEDEDDEDEDEDEEDEDENEADDSDGDDSDSDSDSDDSDSDDSDGDDSDGDDASSDADGLAGASTEYPGDDAPREEVAAWMARAAQKRGLPPELPVMAGLVESDMHNLSYGDADSVGFFQMRVAIWNQGDYAGYPDRPELQLRWFLDHAVAVKKQRIAAGLSVTDSKQYGNWIADIERPAAEYRGRYQLQLDDARRLLASFDPPDASPHAGKHALDALAAAKSMKGTPYKWGGESPSDGFDCSGLVQWAYAKAGISLPRTSQEQFVAPGGTSVKKGDLLPGDLVFFKDSTGDVHHVGISLGGDKFIDAPHTGTKVRIDSLKDSYWSEQFAGGRRFDQLLGRGDRSHAQVLTVVTPSNGNGKG